jgi:hypothetical protein
MLSEGSPFIKRPREIKPSPITPSPNQTPKSTEEKPTRSASGPGVDYNPTRKGLKEFYKARLEGALLGESKALGAALSGFAKGAAVGGLASVLGIAASGKVFPHQDVATHNARVAAGEVVPPKGVSIGQVRATAEPLPEYGAFQRAAIAAREAARAKGKKGK